LLGVATIVMGWDSSVLTRLSLGGTNRLEQSLIDGLKPAAAGAPREATMVISEATAQQLATLGAADTPAELPVEGTCGAERCHRVAEFAAPTPERLRGKVVVVSGPTPASLPARTLREDVVRQYRAMGW
jgi:hypothetical protein